MYRHGLPVVRTPALTQHRGAIAMHVFPVPLTQCEGKTELSHAVLCVSRKVSRWCFFHNLLSPIILPINTEGTVLGIRPLPGIHLTGSQARMRPPKSRRQKEGLVVRDGRALEAILIQQSGRVSQNFKTLDTAFGRSIWCHGTPQPFLCCLGRNYLSQDLG